MDKEIKDRELTPEESFTKEQIWTYQIDGLTAPRIGVTPKNYTLKKILISLVIVVAVSLSMYFSVQVVKRDAFEFNDLSDGTVELVRFGNPVSCKEIDIDYYTEIVYTDSNNSMVYEFKKDESRPVTVIHEFALNCDENIEVINIGADVKQIDGKAFYTCKNLKAIYVDDNNEYYCDIDGVLYNKELTEIICYPMEHDQLLREKYGYEKEVGAEEENYEAYKRDVMTYVLPSSVQKIGKLSFNYSQVKVIYFPEGLKTVETLAFFKTYTLAEIYSYKGENATVTDASAVTEMDEIYLSLPEGLEYIGSDAFAYNYDIGYMFIPESVTYIGHHAFWETAYKEDGEVKGVSVMNIALSEEDFKKQTETGDQWKSQYDNGAFRKTIGVSYEAQREEMK